MKKYLVLLLMLIPLAGLAQRFNGGVMLGLNASQIDGDSWYGYDKAGLMGGAFVFTKFTKKWGAQMELCYSAKGSSTPLHYSYNRKFRLEYIEMPLMGKFKIFPIVEWEFGLSFGYLFSAKQNDGNGYQNFSEAPKKTEMAAFTGINITYLAPLNFNIRYSYSVFPIFSYYTGATYGNGAWYNNVITVGVYYQIGRKKEP
jgi:hypothetical protein